MDIYQRLKKDHDAVRELFLELEGCSSDGARKRFELFTSLRDDLLAHLLAEQEVFYNTLLQRIDEQDLMLESVEVHTVVERLLEEIESSGVEAEGFETRVSELKDLVGQHVAQEESVLFAAARKHIHGAEAQELGEKLEARKAEIC